MVLSILSALFSAAMTVCMIVSWLAVGYILNGLVNKVIPDDGDTVNFVICVVLWPILVPSKIFGTFVLIPCGLVVFSVAIEVGPVVCEAIAWAKRGFHPKPLPSRLAF